MNTANNKKNLLFIIIVFMFSLVGCSTYNHQKALTFFFDLVPDPTNSNESVSIIDTTTKKELVKTNAISFRAKMPEIFVHKPYKEKKCASCHNAADRSRFLNPQPQLCYNCHEDFSKKYKKLHGPVAAGYCTSCHSPHTSKIAKMLLREGQSLCLFCHKSKQVMRNKAHKDIKDSKCIECHNPHGGEDRFVVKTLVEVASDKIADSVYKNTGLNPKLKMIIPAVSQPKFSTAKLYLKNNSGETLDTASRNSEGYFVFSKLPQSGNYFAGEQFNSIKDNSILIQFKDENGKQIRETILKDSTKVYSYLPKASNVLTTRNEKNTDSEVLPDLPAPAELNSKNNKVIILFAFGKSHVPGLYDDSLKQIVKQILQNNTQSIEIRVEGHTDSVGRKKVNEIISRERAIAVKNKLIRLGLKKQMVSIKYFGETRPGAPNANPDGSDNVEGRKHNRRVEVQIVY